MKKTTLLFVAWILASFFAVGVCVCDDTRTNEAYVDICNKFFQQFQDALNNDQQNSYQLRRAFFYAPNARPVLIRVVYNVTYAEMDFCNNTSPSRDIISNETTVVYGWTSSGVFTVVHPLVLNFMQMQLPFVLLRIFYEVLGSERGPEAQTFLWDGTYDLPTLRIHLHIPSLPCIPSDDIFMSALKNFNSLLRVYAGQSDVLKDSGNTYLVGFSLPESGVSGQGFRDASFTPFYLVYMISSIVLYALCVTTAFFIVSKTHSKKGMKKFTKSNSEVLIGFSIVMIVFIVLELVTEFIMAGIWSNAVKDPVIAVYVVTSTVFYCIPGVVSVCMIVREIKRKKDDPERRNQNPREKSITAFPLYSFVWLASYFAYLLLYSFFPAFILAFAYPIRVISVFVFMFTFMILFTVYVITYLTRKVELFPCAQRFEESVKFGCKKESLHCIAKFAVGLLITLMFLYFFLFVFGLLYSLIIGRASVVGSAPLAVLSLLPSILISIAAWIIKKTLLDENKDNETNSDVEPRYNS